METGSNSTPATLAAASGTERDRWFEQEVRPHEKDVRAFLRARFPGITDVDDVVQESLLRVYQAKPAGGVVSARAYHFSVARHAALKVFRKRRIISPVPVNDLPAWRLLDGSPNAAETVSHRDRLELLAEAIASLPSRCGAIMELAAVEGLSAGEIAQRLRLSENTVRVQLARGLGKCVRYFRAREGRR
jgi:RNA polymerase sigma-70 factor (ECF subfamily)